MIDKIFFIVHLFDTSFSDMISIISFNHFDLFIDFSIFSVY